MTPKYPHIEVKLSDGSGNPFAIIAAVSRAMRRAGLPDQEIDDFRKEACSGDYDHVLQTAMATVEVSSARTVADVLKDSAVAFYNEPNGSYYCPTCRAISLIQKWQPVSEDAANTLAKDLGMTTCTRCQKEIR